MTARKRTLVEAAEASILGLPEEPAEAEVTAEAAPAAPEQTAPATEATPAQPTEGAVQPTEQSAPEAAPATPAPGVQESQVDWEKRFKDTQAAYTKQQQRLAELEKQLQANAPPPEVVAAQKVLANPSEPAGVAALRRVLESNPELVDDPVKNAQWNSQKAADIAREVVRAEFERQKDEQRLVEYAKQAKELLGDDIDIAALENDARQAYAIHKNLGKQGNPFITALSAVAQEKLVSKLSRRQGADAAVQEAAAKASVRMERSGPVVSNTAKADVVMTDDEYIGHIVSQMPSFRSTR